MSGSDPPTPDRGEPSTPPAFAATTLAGEGTAETPTAQAAVLQRGAAVGRYIVLEKLGAGGMGIVYAAFDPELDRRIALKLLHPRTFTRRPGTAKARLLREAQALAKLSHPSVITVHDVGTYQEQVFVAMEYVDGVDLATWQTEASRSWQEILTVYLDAGRGLAAAHRAGIVHRDFKPDNVLVGRDARVRVLDFGLARTDADDTEHESGPDAPSNDPVAPREHAASERDAGRDVPLAGPATMQLKLVDLPQRSTQLSTRLTQVGAIMGTPAYMAPEQHQGRRTDARSDQFSFCVALYESLYGQRPFAGRTREQLLMHMLDGNVGDPPRDAPAVPSWIRRILLRGLSTQPAERWPNMEALLAALAPEPKTNRKVLVGGGVGLAAAAAAVVVAWPDEPPAEVPCQGAERKLAGVWDPEVSTQVEQAFEATRRPYAADAFATTRDFLDEYTARWVRMHTDVCEATAVRKEQSQELLDREMMCLGRRLKDVAALTRLLAQADAEMVTAAVAATTNLSQLQPCQDAEFVMSGAAPLSGARAEQAAQLDDSIARARQLDALGRFPDALAEAQAARQAAIVLDEPERRAQSTALLGRVQLHLSDTKSAEPTLLEAVWLADDARADLVRAKAWIDLVWSIGYVDARADPDELDALRHHAEAALRRAGGNALLSATLYENLGGIARQQGNPAEALRRHEQVLAIRRAELGDDAPQVGATLANLAQARAEVGQFEASERELEEAMTILEAKLGRTHPKFATALHMSGNIANFRGAKEQAAMLLRDAIRATEAALPPDHPDLAKIVHDLGEVQLMSDDYANALPQFLRAIKIKRAAYGEDEDHASIANSMTGAGRSLAGLGRIDEAVQLLEDALAMHDALDTKGKDYPETQAALARVLADRDPARARTLALSARAAYSAAGKPELARALSDLIEPPQPPKP